MQKTCLRCKEEKGEESFSKSTRNKDGLKEYCKECVKEYFKKYYEENKEKILPQKIEYLKKHKEEKKKYDKEYYEKHPEKWKEYSKKRRSKDSFKEWRREYEKNKRKEEPIYKLRNYIGSRIRTALLKNFSFKNDSCLKYLEYSVEQLKEYLESKFDQHMSWDNYGTYWHIDHIIPQKLLPYLSMEDENFKKCWALENLRPLEAKENLRKGSKTLEEYNEWKGKQQ